MLLDVARRADEPATALLRAEGVGGTACDGLLADVAQIAARADDADEAQLRADVRTLARALKELLERR